jgi:LmbE family N-acetylglucosaminyl deacetylase
MRIGLRSRTRRIATSIRTPRRAGLSRPPIGAAWGWVQILAGRTANDSLLPGGALVLSPHQDDETIGCGLLMAEKANRGIPVAVVVATDGRSGWFSPSPRPAPHGIGEIRRREWHLALDALAVSRAARFELRFPDGELSDHEGQLVDRIGDLFRIVRPSQVFVTRSGDPNLDHRTLARAVRQAVAETYGSDIGVAGRGVADSLSPGPLGPRPQVFTYRVYPGEGLWPDGRPYRVTIRAAAARFFSSVLGLVGRRALLLRAPGSISKKVAAINAYESQCTLLGGELRYVWGSGVELYWPMDRHGSMDMRGPIEHST